MRVQMWYFEVFRPFKCTNAHIQPQFWSIWSIFPIDSESLPEVRYINWKNSEILGKLKNSEPGGASCVAQMAWEKVSLNSVFLGLYLGCDQLVMQ